MPNPAGHLHHMERVSWERAADGATFTVIGELAC